MTGTVLIADDSPTIQRRASGILTGEGIKVITVSNGVAAIKKLEAAPPQLILADVAMPGRDGYEVCEHVKSAAALSSIPVLLIYGEDDPFEEERAMRARADGRIKKPFVPEDLIGIVNRYLAQATAAVAAKEAAGPARREEAVRAAVVQPVDVEPEVAVDKGPTPENFEGEVAFSAAFGDEPPIVSAEPMVEPAAEDEAGVPETGNFESSLETASEAVTRSSDVPPAADSFGEPEGEAPLVFHVPQDIPEFVTSEEAAVEQEQPALEPVEAAPLEAATTSASEEPAAVSEAEAGPAASAEEPSAASEAFATEGVPIEPSATPVSAGAEQAPPVAPSRTVDAAAVYSIVQRVVAKMSPPALPPDAIEDMARKFADEIYHELESSSH